MKKINKTALLSVIILFLNLKSSQKHDLDIDDSSRESKKIKLDADIKINSQNSQQNEPKTPIIDNQIINTELTPSQQDRIIEETQYDIYAQHKKNFHKQRELTYNLVKKIYGDSAFIDQIEKLYNQACEIQEKIENFIINSIEKNTFEIFLKLLNIHTINTFKIFIVMFDGFTDFLNKEHSQKVKEFISKDNKDKTVWRYSSNLKKLIDNSNFSFIPDAFYRDTCFCFKCNADITYISEIDIPHYYHRYHCVHYGHDPKMAITSLQKFKYDLRNNKLLPNLIKFITNLPSVLIKLIIDYHEFEEDDRKAQFELFYNRLAKLYGVRRFTYYCLNPDIISDNPEKHTKIFDLT